MVIINIADNQNCTPVELRVFHDLEPPRLVSQVRLERHPGAAEWYAVTGWTAANRSCPAFVQKVDDSGDGTAFLLYGGNAGLRLQPVDRQESWRADHPRQWGEPFLIMADRQDIWEPS